MAQRVKTDWVLFWVTVGMVCFGLVMVYSASSFMAQQPPRNWSAYFLVRQAAWAVAAFAAMMWLKRMDYRRFNSQRWAFGAILAVLPLLILVYFLDSHAHRWLKLGPWISIQPSEFAKPALILFLAFFVADRVRIINNRRTLLGGLLTVGAMAVWVVLADLGTAVVLVITAAVVFYVAGLDWKYVRIVMLVGALGILLAVALKPYRVVRVFGFVNPSYSALDHVPWGDKIKDYLKRASYNRDPGYHVRQSEIAVGSGAVTGRGLMEGRQKLLYLPEAHTDFIYAVVGEELGLAGSSALVGIFLVILWRGLRLVRHAPDDFGRYLALGVTTMIVVQGLINMSVVLGLAPTKGIPLPMISYGGSSLLSTLISMGLLLSVSEQTG
ncbi:MAG: putative peptidoglycan glycosyltransferase FtsW [Bryobacteraceae bacterium]